MPLYDFVCPTCKRRQEDVSVPYSVTMLPCVCGRVTHRQFPVQAALGYQPFEAYYDEGLGCDVTGRQEKRRIMQALNVIEAGDKVHGAREFDRHAPHHVKPEPPRGEPFVPPAPAGEADWDVAVERGAQAEKVDVRRLKTV